MIPLASPDIRDTDIALCNEVLRSGQLVQGAQVEAFEQAITEFAGFGHCAAVSSGTAALHLALKALDIGDGDKVIVADFSFTATANVIENVGAECVFCDVAAGTYVIGIDSFEEALTRAPEARALMLVHEFGYPADVQEMAARAHALGMVVIEDAACALGSVSAGRHVGYYGDLACFSFHPRKAITCGEGGAILGRDAALLERVRVLRNHGITRTHAGIDFTAAGLNYRMTDFQAALCRGQLQRFDTELQRRREQAAHYHVRLQEHDLFDVPEPHPGHSWQSYMLSLSPNVDRNALIKAMLENGVQTNLGAQAIHRLDYYQRRYRHPADAFPVASHLYEFGLVLPLYGKLSNQQLDQVADTLLQQVRRCSST